jgi:hypothetical protein
MSESMPLSPQACLTLSRLQTECKASASLAGSEGASYMVSLPRAAPVVSYLPGSSLVRLNGVSPQSVVRWLSRVNGPCPRSRDGLANVGLVN